MPENPKDLACPSVKQVQSRYSTGEFSIKEEKLELNCYITSHNTNNNNSSVNPYPNKAASGIEATLPLQACNGYVIHNIYHF